MTAPHHSTKRIGELLVERGLLTPAHLEEALAEQRATKEFLGAILVRRKAVKPDDLLGALSEQFGIPHESLSPERVDWTVVGQFPPSVFASEAGFPIRADAESVTVAIANPLDAAALSDLEKAVKFRAVKRVLVLPEELQRVRQAYRERSLRRIANQLGDNASR